MHTLKYYYWIVDPTEGTGISPKGLDGPRPTKEEIMSIRYVLIDLQSVMVILLDMGYGVSNKVFLVSADCLMLPRLDCNLHI